MTTVTVRSADEVLADARQAALLGAATWRGSNYVLELRQDTGATRTHRLELAGMLVEQGDISGMGELLGEHLRGEADALSPDEIERSTTTMSGAVRGWDEEAADESARKLWASIIWCGLLGADGRFVSERLGEMTHGEPGPFRDPFEFGTGDALSISEEAERELYGDGWWPMLTNFAVSGATFDYLMDKVESGELLREALAGMPLTAARLERVLEHAARRGEVLEAEFVRYQTESLFSDQALLERALTASGCEDEALFVLGYEDGWGWEWVRAEWLAGLNARACAEISRNILRVGEAPIGGECCDGSTMRLVLSHVRGAAASAARPEGAGTFARESLVSLIDELFGESRDVAWGLLNAATNLVELTDVVARLG